MAQPHRVLFFPFFFLPERWNGMDEHLLMLANHIDRRRFELAVLEHPSDGEQTRLLSERGRIRLLEAPYAVDADGVHRFRSLVRFFRKERVSLLHLHSPTVGGQLVPALAARVAGVRATVSTYQQIQPRKLPRKSRLLSGLNHALLIDRVIAVSNDVGVTAQKMAGIGGKRITVIPNGIEVDVECETRESLTLRRRGEVRLGYFGRLSPEKGLSVLLHAFALLEHQHPEATLFLAGDGPQRDELESLARKLQIESRTHFLGFRTDARALMKEMDLIVHAPEYEGFGLVMLEAMAARRPLVVNDAPGGMRELVHHGFNGLIASAGSPVALAEGMGRLVESPALRLQLGENGRRLCEERYSAEVMARETQAIYEQLLP
jgi:glycosyltransferase involved in cell wall biosynthesis